MPGIEITQTTNAASMKRVIEQFTRRQIAARLRATGVLAAQAAERSTSFNFQRREGSRRRSPGTPHISGNWQATYTDLSEFSAGRMEFSLTNPSPAVIFQEYGTTGHEIAPHDTYLAWPGHVQKGPVSHPGSTKNVGRFRSVISFAMREKFPGIKPIPID